MIAKRNSKSQRQTTEATSSGIIRNMLQKNCFLDSKKIKTSLDFSRENEERDKRSENNLIDIEELRMAGKPLQSGRWLVD